MFGADGILKTAKKTVLKIRHLRIVVKFDFWVGDFDLEEDERFLGLNQKLMTLTNIFRGSTKLRTVDCYWKKFRRRRQHTHRPSNLVGVLYALAKLKQPNRIITLHGFPPTVQTALEQRMTDGTPQPRDAIGVLFNVRRPAKRNLRSMVKLPAFHHTFIVFLHATESIASENLPYKDVIGHVADKSFCEDVTAVRMFFEEHEAAWRKWVSEQPLVAMREVQEEIRLESQRQASEWLLGQRDDFVKLKRWFAWVVGQNKRIPTRPRT